MLVEVTGYDWSRIPPQPRWIQWLADRRVAVRVVLLILDLAIVLTLVYMFGQGYRQWWNVLQILVWASITAQFGWFLPRQVDKWREQERLTTATPAEERSESE
jgi:hypothetical protein